MGDEFLAGGSAGTAVRVGETVRRIPPAGADFVHDLLAHFQRCGWPGAPRFRGIDSEGREVLSFIDGHVAWESAQPPDVWCEASLVRTARLVRQFHDLTAGTHLAGTGEVVCHNDLAPRNTIYRETDEGLRPFAFIDWDFAAPGDRVHDIGQVCWRFLDLGPHRLVPAAVGRLMRVICDAYGLKGPDRARLIDAILWRQDLARHDLEAASGQPMLPHQPTHSAPSTRSTRSARPENAESGAMESIQLARDWVESHRSALTAELRL